MAINQNITQVNLSTLTDEEVIEHYISTNNMDIFGELYKRYAHLVYGTCIKYLKDKSLSRDVTMDIFEIVLNKVKTSNIQSFNHWIYTVSRNKCFNILKSKGKVSTEEWDERKVENNSNDYMENEGFLSLYNNETESNEVLLQKAIQTLKPEQKACINAFYFDNLSYEEISKKLGFSILKVKSYLQNGKRNLKARIIELQSKT